MPDPVKVAAVQMTSGADVDANLVTASSLVEIAAREGARVVALPENFAFMGLRDTDKRAIAEADGAGPIQDRMSAVARELGVWIVGGTAPIRLAGDERVAAASIVWDDHGERVARYDKIHLFDVQVPDGSESHRESANIAPGRKPVVVDTPAGRLGLAVCYDIRFPELFRSLAAEGAEWFVLPSAFTVPTGRAHWETLLRARAIENLCDMVAPAQSGWHANGRETWGDSLIVDYWGRILARRPRGRGIVVAALDRAAQRAARERFPALSHRVL